MKPDYYQVVVDRKLYNVELEVRRLMREEGWTPIGGITIAIRKVNSEGDFDDNGEDTPVYYQAMMKK